MAKVRSSINYQVGGILKEHIGIGESKRETRNSSSLKGENGHKVSNKFHSYKTLDNVRSHLQNLGKFFKENYKNKDMSQITSKVIKEWIESKNLTYNTASNYLSELNKLADHFSFTRDQIKELRTEFKTTLKENILTTRAYSQKLLDKIQLKDPREQIVFQLQKEYGLRVSEASHINISKQLNGNTLSYQQKGGMWSQKEISKELADKIKEHAKDGKFHVAIRTYQDHFKAEVIKQGGEWNGTHGIRHSFAQKKLEEGYSKAEVSKMMGHVREEITNTYLR